MIRAMVYKNVGGDRIITLIITPLIITPLIISPLIISPLILNPLIRAPSYKRMSRSSKYDAFQVSAPFTRPSKLSPDATREYVQITCPHCHVQFGETTAEAIGKMKSTHCAKHLIECPMFKTTTKTDTKSIIVVASKTNSEIAELKEQMAAMKQKMDGQQEQITELQDKTTLYDGVLEAVMPSLVLPLTAPEERAKITLREAAIKDIKDITPLTLLAPVDAIPKDMHTAILEQKNEMIATEKERREELKEAHNHALDALKQELEHKDSELAKTMQEKREADKRAHEANQTVYSLSSRVDKLQRERDVFKAKLDAALTGHESTVRNSKFQQGQKRAMSLEAGTAAAVACEREFAQREQKRARQEGA